MTRYRFITAAIIAALFGPLTRSFGADSFVFTTMAGNSGLAYADGKGAAVRMALPEAIAVGADGTVYVADSNNYVVRKITADGTTTTLAGTPGVYGYRDGPAGANALFNIFGIAVDTAGNVYITDSYANTVRKITPTGTVSTVAGDPGTAGSTDGVGAAARFNQPRGLSVDAAGNVYVADMDNATIRKITPGGVVSTLAGTAGSQGSLDGLGTAARFRLPYAVAADTTGNVYVADWQDATIRKISPSGYVTTLAGLPGFYAHADGAGSDARFDTPAGITVDALGNVYVADRLAHVVRKITPTGVATTVAGSPYRRGYVDGLRTEGRFHHPSGVAATAAGVLYVADTFNSLIRRVGTDGNVTTIAGQPPEGTADGMRSAARFFSPQGVTVDSAGNVYIADTFNHTIRKMTPDGTVTTIAGGAGVAGTVDGTAATARFAYPTGVAVDAVGNIYVADYTNCTIRKITPSGLVGTLAGTARLEGSNDGTGAAARFSAPSDIKIDRDGNLIVADRSNHTLRKVTPTGVVTTLAGAALSAGNTDGPALQARFNSPAGLAIDQAGNIFIADAGNHVIRKLSTSGTVTTIAGVAGETGFANGAGSAARFTFPTSVAVDGSGTVYVSDSGNWLIRRISNGVVSTIGGVGYIGYSDGVGEDAAFFDPAGIACDATGNLYIADENNHAIRKAGMVRPEAPTSRLFNLSVRADFAANERLITGVVVAGPEKPILLRAVGPGLAPYVGTTPTATDPRLEIYNEQLNLVETNEDWGNGATLRDTAVMVGAFPLPASSLDAATLRSLTGAKTVHVLTPGPGLGLVEAYDAGTGVTSRLINVSARYKVSTGAGVLVAGFVIQGTGQKTVLIRGAGPTLASFGVTTALSNPRVELYNSDQRRIADNDDWAAGLASTFREVGAFDFVPSSKDAALLISLPPGSYSAQLSGSGGATGEGLVEVYEVGN